MTRRNQNLAGLDEPVRRRPLGNAEEVVVIDTGDDLESLEDGDWKEDFEFPDDGSFDLFLWDGRLKRAALHGRVLDDACSLLEQFMAVDPDDCKPGEVPALTIDYVRVVPECRGKGYAVKLVDAAIKAFVRRGWWVYADCYSQLIYKNLSSVLGKPFVALPAEGFERDEEGLYQPTDTAILARLDAHPVENKSHQYKSGFQLANERHVHVLWKR